MRRRLIICCLFLFSSIMATIGQELVSLQLKNVTLKELFLSIERQTQYRFNYRNATLGNDANITVNYNNVPLENILDDILPKYSLQYELVGNNTIIVTTVSKEAATPSTQSQKITGVVYDEYNEPLIGAAIRTLDGSTGSITDYDGRFTIEIPSNTEIEISYVGYDTKIIKPQGDDIKIILSENNVDLNEVVVTALGISREDKSLGYSVSKVDGGSLNEIRNINVMNSLSGKVAGVDISQPNTGIGGSSKVIIRGNSSLTGNSSPLYVIDGVAMDNSKMGEADEWGGIDLGDGLSFLNPNDIENISVLKGPAAAALYGSRAGNGVVLITTKKWKKNDESNFSVEFNSNNSFDRVMRQYSDLQYIYGQGIGNPPQNIAEATYMWSWGAKMDPNLEFISFDGQYRDYGVKPNNINNFFRTGANLNNSLSISGGNESSNINFSFGNARMTDIVPNSDLTRYTFNLRGYMKLWKRLELDAKINFSLEDVNNRPYLGYSGANVALALLGLPANIDQSWLRDYRTNDAGNYQYWNSQTRIINPYYSLYNMQNESKRDRTLGYISLNYKFTDWLDLKIKTGIDYYNYLYENYSPISTPLAETGEMSHLHANTMELNSEFLLSAKKQINPTWSIHASIGGNIMYTDSYTNTIQGKGQIDRNRIAINNYSEYFNAYVHPRKQINSLYAFANIGFKSCLYLDLTARNDWSSTLPVQNNSYFYPSAALSFIATDAFPIIKSKWLNHLQARASYAEVGSDVDPYVLSRVFLNYPYTFNGAQLTTDVTSAMPNTDLKPSRKKGFEAGLNIKLLNWHLDIDANVYSQNTINEIIKLPISQASAYDYAYINAGKINNRGWELSMNIVPYRNKKFNWNINVNLSQNENKILQLHPDAKMQEIARASWVNSFIVAQEGGSYGDILGYDFKRNEDGEILLDSKGLPQRSDEQVVLGNGQYKIVGGFSNTISYQNFTLRVFFDFKWGADILSMSNLKLNQYGATIPTLEGREAWAKSEIERIAQGVSSNDWVATGGFLAPGVIEQADGTYVSNNIYVNPMDYWSTIANNSILTPYIYDASFIKLREIVLSYSFPQDLLAKTKFIKGASLSVTARNLWSWSKVPNIDPESTYSVSNGQGYEYGSLPQRSSFGFNVNLKF